MERCPNCRASYQQGAECRRFGMDLSLLLAIESQAQALELTAVRQIAENDLAGAEAVPNPGAAATR